MNQHADECTKSGDRIMAGCTCDGYHTFDELYDHRITERVNDFDTPGFGI